MNHHEVRARLSEYLDGELPLRDRALVDAHLDGCRPCRDDLSELRVTVRLLRGLEDVPPRGAIADAVMERIRAGEGVPSWWGRLAAWIEDLTQPRVVRPLVLCTMGLAALLVVRPELMGAVTKWLGNPAPAATSGPPPSLVSLTVADPPPPRPVVGALGAASADGSSERSRVRVGFARPFAASGPIELRGDLVRRHVPRIISGTPLVGPSPLFASPGWPSMRQPTSGFAEPVSFERSVR